MHPPECPVPPEALRRAEVKMRRFMWANPRVGAGYKPDMPEGMVWYADVPIAVLDEQQQTMAWTPFGRIWQSLSAELADDLRSGRASLFPAAPALQQPIKPRPRAQPTRPPWGCAPAAARAGHCGHRRT
jgi:hypothetical protein